MSNHAVYASTADGSRYLVIPTTTFDRAHDAFARMDNKLREFKADGRPCRIANSDVSFFSVREDDDENWNASPSHTDHGGIRWGWLKADYLPGGSQWDVSKSIRLSEVQQDAMAGAAEHGHIPSDTHHKCYRKLHEMGLIISDVSYSNLTPLGEAVAERAYAFLHGATVAEVKAIRLREVEERMRQQQIRVEDVKARAESLALKLAGVRINGQEASVALLANSYGTPVYQARSTGANRGHYEFSLEDLEAIVSHLSE